MRPKVLFHSPRSDRSWPKWLQRALPECEVTTDIGETANVIAAVVWTAPPGGFSRFPDLRLVQVLGAGVDQLLVEPDLPDDVAVARLIDPGLARLVAEYVLLHTLALHRGLYACQAAQRERQWRYVTPRLAEEHRVAVIGTGAIGSTCLALLRHNGFQARGWAMSARPEGEQAHVVTGEKALGALLADADTVVFVLPSTSRTRGMVDAGFLAQLKPGAGIINVGRGDLVVEADLLAAIDTGQVYHAVLDVFREEPLPDDHPFWMHPCVTITPHNAGATHPERAAAVVAGNIRLALAGKPVAGTVDRQRGY